MFVNVNEIILDNFLDHIETKRYKLAEIKFVKRFKKLSTKQQLELIPTIEIAQAESIVRMMDEGEEEIFVPKFGSFKIHPYRKYRLDLEYAERAKARAEKEQSENNKSNPHIIL